MLTGKLFFKYSNEPGYWWELELYYILFISLCACDTSLVDDAAATLLSKPWFVCKSWRKRHGSKSCPCDVNAWLCWSALIYMSWKRGDPCEVGKMALRRTDRRFVISFFRPGQDWFYLRCVVTPAAAGCTCFIMHAGLPASPELTNCCAFVWKCVRGEHEGNFWAEPCALLFIYFYVTKLPSSSPNLMILLNCGFVRRGTFRAW